MIEISDIKDRDSLKTWLTEWPEQAGLDEEAAKALAGTIAHRCAMRVLPVWWRWSRTDAARQLDLTALPVLRSVLTSGVAVKIPTPDVRNATRARVTAADNVTATIAANAITANANAANARNAAIATSLAIAAARARADATSIATAAANAANAAADATTAGDFWDCVRKDCQIMAGRTEVLETSLWHSSKSPIEAIWTNVKDAAVEPEWSFWIKWYEDALAGRAPDWDLLEKIALIDSEIWDAGPVSVADAIAKLELANAQAATPNAEEIRVNDDNLFEMVARSGLPSRTLRDANERIADVIRQIRKVQDNNQYSGLAEEADLLEDSLDRYGDNALRLYEVTSKAVRRVGFKVHEGVLPENDNLIHDVTGDLQNTADDIYNFDEDVKQTVDARINLRFAKLNDAEKSKIGILTEHVAQRSEVRLAQELTEDVQALEREDEPTEDTAPNRYRLGSRLVKVIAYGGTATVGAVAALSQAEEAVAGATYLWQIVRPLLGL